MGLGFEIVFLLATLFLSAIFLNPDFTVLNMREFKFECLLFGFALNLRVWKVPMNGEYY